jgi:hypothetical protein
MPREAVLMVANRKVRVASLTGNVIIFEKDVPVRVPPAMVPECMQVGIIPADVDNENYAPEEEKKPTVPQGVDREEVAFMRERNERGDFTGAGRPDLRILASLLGFRPDRHEVEKLWEKIRAEEGEAKSLEA